MKSLTPGIRYRIGAEASKKYPNSLRDARQDEKRKAYIEGAIDEAIACIQKDEEIADLTANLISSAEENKRLNKQLENLGKVLDSGRALLSIMQDRDSNLETLLSMITEALKQ